ncbi:hypothetical protein QYF36_023006 [Acer negundo]|nr:hypothetical protein QYF36_023006 [Acer negundo]
MGFASKESGVLEIHKKPITAIKVMKRNPRHCVTRSDVFRSKLREAKPLKSSIQRVHKDDKVDGILNSSEQISKLRSCLKKEENSITKSRGFRVRFALDEDDKEDSLKRSFRVSSFKAVV